jgi:hypothetical protein
MVLLAAAAASLLPFVAPLFQASPGATARESRDSIAFLVASLAAIALAPALGWTVLAREISNRRLGFFFSRPLSSVAIWSGKLVGTFFVVLAGVGIILAPTFLADGGALPQSDPRLPSLPVVLFAAFVALVLCHALSVALRSRSMLLLLDFGLGIVVCSLFSLTPAVFVFNWALGAYFKGLALFGVALLLGLVAAGLASVAWGRTDIRGAHRALSATFWSVAGLSIGLFWLYSIWILSARPTDITAVTEAAAAPRGGWLTVSGTTWGRFDYAPTFLWNPSSNDFIRTGPKWGAPTFSRDGNRAAWFRWHNTWRPNRLTLELVTVDLGRPEPKPVPTGIAFRLENPDSSDVPSSSLFSPSGNRIAELHNAILSVYDIGSGKTLASTRVSGVNSTRFFFVTDDLLRIYAREDLGNPGEVGASEAGAVLNIYEFDIRNKKLERTGRTQPLRRPFPLLVDTSGDRLLIREGAAAKILSLHDARTGEAVQELGVAESPDGVRADFLSDGRIVVAEVRSGIARLRLCSPDGQEIRVTELGPGRQIFFGGEAAPGQLFVGVGPDAGGARHNMNAAIFLVRLATGESHRVGQELYPTVSFPRFLSVDPTFQAPPGSPATRLFYGPHGSLITLDPLTGEKRVLLGRFTNL